MKNTKVFGIFSRKGAKARRFLWVCLLILGCGGGEKNRAALVIDESVAGDFEEVAWEAWRAFMGVFGGMDCFGDVILKAERGLDDRAMYDVETATVVVRVPASTAILREALVHEWAHHVEFQCEEEMVGLRESFMVAQGVDEGRPWRSDQLAWVDMPSEMYAEAVIEVVFGRRQVATGLWLRGDAVDVVGNWAFYHGGTEDTER